MTALTGAIFVQAYDFDFLIGPYMDEHPRYSGSVRRAIEELRKFLKMPTKCAGPIAVMSKRVDRLWHTFIAHTAEYAAFCDKAYDGALLHHQPHSDANPVPGTAISNFYLCYDREFGTPPEMWFEDVPDAHKIPVSLGDVPLELLGMRWSGWPGWKD